MTFPVHSEVLRSEPPFHLEINSFEDLEKFFRLFLNSEIGSIRQAIKELEKARTDLKTATDANQPGPGPETPV